MKVHLTVVQGRPQGKTIPVIGPRFLIGRSEACQLRPRSELISREHAELVVRVDSVFLRGLGSRNGIQVNGATLAKPARLRNGDLIQVGPLSFAVSIQGASLVAATAASAPASDDEVAAWLIAAGDPSTPSGVPAGQTLVGAAADEGHAAPTPAPARPVRRASSDAAGEILRKMAEQRQRSGGAVGLSR